MRSKEKEEQRRIFDLSQRPSEIRAFDLRWFRRRFLFLSKVFDASQEYARREMLLVVAVQIIQNQEGQFEAG